ncbi:MAG: hypothetical protein NZM28_10980 [Fimbriimonadales bacterium]|nr:hypothetical protein [Fimbriimonadales bacterium]
MFRSVGVRTERFNRTASWRVLYAQIRQWLLLLSGKQLIWTTQRGVEIVAERGRKSEHDFVVKYRDTQRSRNWRTPKHIHLIVELYVKEAYQPRLTYELRDHLISVYDKVQPISQYPPTLQVYQQGDEQRFASLDAVGEYSVEFLLVVSELIFIQEKTNYPQGSLTRALYEDFGVKDRFSVVQKAAFRGTG